VVVDTHLFLITRRPGAAKGDAPQEVERQLMREVQQDRWIAFSHDFIHHDREI
jgi:endonuclease-3